ncbi:unnamed protein product [Schistosoma turkestanicum]|nr:unnamed protein product [Schistosoma turkestanicum]
MNHLLMQSTLMEALVGKVNNQLAKLKYESNVYEKSLHFLLKRNTLDCGQKVSVKDLLNQYVIRRLLLSQASVNELYGSQKTRDLVGSIGLIVMQSFEELEHIRNKPLNHNKASSDVLVDKQLSHIRSFLEIGSKRKHLFSLQSELQNLKCIQWKGGISKADLNAKLQLIELQSKVHYIKHRIRKLRSEVECNKTYISGCDVLGAEIANFDSLLEEKWKMIHRLHEENEKLLDNLPLICRQTKQIKQQLSDQITDTHQIVHELTSNNLLRDISERIQDISLNERTFPSGNTYANILRTDGLYINCCKLYSLEPNLKIPDVLLKCILTQIRESWLAENSFKLLRYLVVNLNKEFHTSEKLQNYDTTFQTKELKHLLSYVKNLKELIGEIKQRISSCNEFITDWREVPVRQMML